MNINAAIIARAQKVCGPELLTDNWPETVEAFIDDNTSYELLDRAKTLPKLNTYLSNCGLKTTSNFKEVKSAMLDFFDNIKPADVPSYGLKKFARPVRQPVQQVKQAAQKNVLPKAKKSMSTYAQWTFDWSEPEIKRSKTNTFKGKQGGTYTTFDPIAALDHNRGKFAPNKEGKVNGHQIYGLRKIHNYIYPLTKYGTLCQIIHIKFGKQVQANFLTPAQEGLTCWLSAAYTGGTRDKYTYEYVERKASTHVKSIEKSLRVKNAFSLDKIYDTIDEEYFMSCFMHAKKINSIPQIKANSYFMVDDNNSFKKLGVKLFSEAFSKKFPIGQNDRFNTSDMWVISNLSKLEKIKKAKDIWEYRDLFIKYFESGDIIGISLKKIERRLGITEAKAKVYNYKKSLGEGFDMVSFETKQKQLSLFHKGKKNTMFSNPAFILHGPGTSVQSSYTYSVAVNNNGYLVAWGHTGRGSRHTNGGPEVSKNIAKIINLSLPDINKIKKEAIETYSNIWNHKSKLLDNKTFTDFVNSVSNYFKGFKTYQKVTEEDVAKAVKNGEKQKAIDYITLIIFFNQLYVKNDAKKVQHYLYCLLAAGNVQYDFLHDGNGNSNPGIPYIKIY